jgi:hypothetical protein
MHSSEKDIDWQQLVFLPLLEGAVDQFKPVANRLSLLLVATTGNNTLLHEGAEDADVGAIGVKEFVKPTLTGSVHPFRESVVEGLFFGGEFDHVSFHFVTLTIDPRAGKRKGGKPNHEVRP